MTRASILEYVAALRNRYRSGRRSEKSAILTEFCLVTGYHRKSAIRLLNRKPQPHKKGRRGCPRQYGHEVTPVLKIAWEATGRICSKRLAPFMPQLIESLEHHGEIAPHAKLRDQLVHISPATIDRTKMSRRGNRHLKRALFQIAAPLVWFDKGDNLYKELYQRKKAEGRQWYKAMPFVCAALARHIYHCLKFNDPYDVKKAFRDGSSVAASEPEWLSLGANLEEKLELMEASLYQMEQ